VTKDDDHYGYFGSGQVKDGIDGWRRGSGTPAGACSAAAAKPQALGNRGGRRGGLAGSGGHDGFGRLRHVVLVAIAALAGASLAGLRALGVTRDHPWIQRMASRPWRDGQDVLRIAMRHLPDVFVITPSGSLLAPSVVELQLNPADLDPCASRWTST
jgi:hypothetical protein